VSNAGWRQAVEAHITTIRNLTMRLRHLILSTALSLAAAGAQAADSYTIDPVTSSAIFRVKHFNVAYFYGTFNAIEGTLQWDNAAPASSKVEITIQAASVDSRNEKRDAHLASPDFFDAKQFATLKFVSSSVKATDATHFEIAGDFTMHGVTKPLTLAVIKTGEGKDPKGSQRIGFETTFVVKRSDFGMDKMLENIGDEVTVTFSTEGIRK
jgi:polyisoprenoid-binding protein YceI